MGCTSQPPDEALCEGYRDSGPLSTSSYEAARDASCRRPQALGEDGGDWAPAVDPMEDDRPARPEAEPEDHDASSVTRWGPGRK